MKAPYLIYLLTFSAVHLYGQEITSVELLGPARADQGSSADFTVIFYSGHERAAASGGLGHHWDTEGCTLERESPGSAGVYFGSPGTARVFYQYMTFNGSFFDHKTVLVEGSPCRGLLPSAENASRRDPGTLTLRSAPPPLGFSCRWTDGEGKLLGEGRDFTTPVLSETTVYYLAYRHAASGCLTEQAAVRAMVTGENHVRSYRARRALFSEEGLKTGAPGQSWKRHLYLDGLGRPMQETAEAASASGLDIISPISYDPAGRQHRDYLPYAVAGASPGGSFRAAAAEEHAAWYAGRFSGDARGFTERDFEASPRQRALREWPPGESWKPGSGRGKSRRERPSEAGEQVGIWSTDAAGLPVYLGQYPDGALWVVEERDENGMRSSEYRDSRGRTVLSKVQASDSPGRNHSGWLCTYYVYDDLDRLCALIPPKATGILLDSPSLAGDSELAAGLYFLYRYDGRGRTVERKMPGKAAEYLVYDRSDRLVATGCASPGRKDIWHYTLYDFAGRPVQTGLVRDSRSREELQACLDSLPGSGHATITENTARVRKGGRLESAKYSGHEAYLASESVVLKPGFSFRASAGRSFRAGTGPVAGEDRAGKGFPAEEGEILTVHYYDGYENIQGGGHKRQEGFPEPEGRTAGLLTGKLVKDLASGKFYRTLYYYDRYAREVQRLSEHRLGGSLRTSTRYDFENRPVEVLTRLEGPVEMESAMQYSYSPAGGLSRSRHRIGKGSWETLSELEYGELGELKARSLPGPGLRTEYAHNIRGWLKTAHSPVGGLFGMELYYGDTEGGGKQWNGNISGMSWTDRNGRERRYDYSYDAAGRITGAGYSVPGSPGEKGGYSLSGISYDANSNILTMERNSRKPAGDYGRVDALAYRYGRYGNRLLKVSDSEKAVSQSASDFREGGSAEYRYDGRGNLVSEGDRGIKDIVYSHLDLPEKIGFVTGAELGTDYDAEGQKLGEGFTGEDGKKSRLDYIGDFVFRDGRPEYLLLGDGKVSFEGGKPVYAYFVRDHLGNVRQEIRRREKKTVRATMELSAAAEEERQFEQLPQSRQSGREHNTTPGGDRSAWLNADRGRILGPARTQQVGEGDSIRLSVNGKYRDRGAAGLPAGSFAVTGAREGLVNALTEQGKTAVAAGPGPLAVYGILDLLIRELAKKPVPEAYMMYALYDAEGKLYGKGKRALGKNAMGRHEKLEINIYIVAEGRMEAFLVNETGEDVWFDDFTVETLSPMVVQEKHYDPWGLELDGLGYRYRGIPENRYGFNGKELLKAGGLGWYDFGARMYDPVIGRWMGVDPLGDRMPSWSPYSYAFNNPIVFVDPDGKLPIPVITGLIGAAGGAIYGVAKGKSWRETLALAAGGFVTGATLGIGTVAVGAVGGVATIGGAGITYVYGASGIIGAGLGNLTEQGTKNLLGVQQGFDENEFVMSLVFSIPETLLSKGITGPMSNSVKGSIAKELTKEATFQQEKQFLKETAKSLKEMTGSQLTNKQARIAAQKLYNLGRETEKEVINATIYLTDKSVDVTTVFVEKMIMEPIKE